jgi:hypothetical protein
MAKLLPFKKKSMQKGNGEGEGMGKKPVNGATSQKDA